MILPAKFEHERIMFVIDYGDIIPWGSVIDRAKITVEVSSGDDPHPQRVFSQVWSVDGSIVTYQVRNGVVGVIYNLMTGVQIDGEWIYKQIKLAIVPDQVDVGSLYPLTRFFTSLPYYQYTDDSLEIGLTFDDAFTRGIFQSYTVPPESIDLALEFVEAATRPVYWTYNLDDRMDLGLAFVSGETRSIYITYTCPPEGVDLSFAFASASTASILITQTQVPESIDFGLAFVSASTEVA